MTFDDPGTRIKGAATALHFAVVDAGTLRPGVPGEVLPSGSRLQLRYEAGDNTHIGLLGIDSAGSVAVLFPENGASLIALPDGTNGSLPFSLTLDATPGSERFFAVFAKDAAPLQSIRAALESLAGTDPATLGPLPLPSRLPPPSRRLLSPGPSSPLAELVAPRALPVELPRGAETRLLRWAVTLLGSLRSTASR